MSELPTLRGLGDELAGLPELGKTLSNLFGGGNSDTIAAVKKKILEDPDYASKLSQLSKDNPELYGALKLGKYGEQLAKTPKSSDTIYRETRQGQELQKGALDIKSAQETIDNAPIHKQILGLQLADLQDRNKQISEQAKGFPGLQGKDLGSLADGMLAGKPDNNTMAYVAQNPQLLQTFHMLLQGKQQERGLQAQSDRQDKSIAAQFQMQDKREEKARNQSYLDEGAKAWNSSKVGTSTAWADYLKNPDGQNSVNSFMDNPKLADKALSDPKMRPYSEIATWLSQNKEKHVSTEVLKNNLAIDRYLKDFKKGDVDKVLALQSINDALESNSNLRGTRKIKMVPGNMVPGKSGISAFMDRNKLVLFDPTTNEQVDANDITGVQKFAEKSSSEKYTEQDILKNAAGAKNASPKDIAELKQREPEMYRILVQRGDIKETVTPPITNIMSTK